MGLNLLCLAMTLVMPLLACTAAVADDSHARRPAQVVDMEADTASVTILVRGMLKSRSGAT